MKRTQRKLAARLRSKHRCSNRRLFSSKLRNPRPMAGAVNRRLRPHRSRPPQGGVTQRRHNKHQFSRHLNKLPAGVTQHHSSKLHHSKQRQPSTLVTHGPTAARSHSRARRINPVSCSRNRAVCQPSRAGTINLRSK